AQPLEDPCRRMDLVGRLAPDRPFHEFGKVARRLEGLVRTPPLDGPGNTAGMALLAEKAENARHVPRLELIDHVGGARPLPTHAHVERPFQAEGEAALR